MPLRELAKEMLGPKLLGTLDYYRFPGKRQSWGGPFNGQLRRQEVYSRLVASIAFDAIVETGTHLGTTTEFLTRTAGKPVYSVESNPRAYGYARARLRRHKQAHVVLGDSRSAIRRWLDAGLSQGTVLFYLDAHWDADLPLAEELELALAGCPRAVVMIDDFRVPWDEGYGYDDYGQGKALTLEYVAPVVDRQQAEVFLPGIPSHDETGSVRGWAVIASHPALVEVLSRLEGLQRSTA